MTTQVLNNMFEMYSSEYTKHTLYNKYVNAIQKYKPDE